jgi:hypothetical protein
VVLPRNVNIFFTLLTFRHFSYTEKLPDHLVTYFLDVREIEPLLIVFSFDIIREDIDTLLTSFSAYFEAEIQDELTPEALYLVNELAMRGAFDGADDADTL